MEPSTRAPEISLKTGERVVLPDRGLLTRSNDAIETEGNTVQKRSYFGYCLPTTTKQEARYCRSERNWPGLATN